MTRPLPPWLTVTTAPPPAVLDARDCRTAAALFTEIAELLAFPDYFGHNWDALVDCLTDATDEGPVTLIVAHAEELLADEPPHQFTTLLDALTLVGGLTVTLSAAPGHEDALRARVGDALADSTIA
ncbi:barstar family protein [Sinosporangium siamense]|uniref:Barstar (barnase inhibitor) domain-containing protein n=1 Tax=Sinosporangium siamense TaxID=1367973 RepID=A0A919VBJ7_9ACTN|nr:barstar family protein [Sinosporangium siamense]GII97458.1 hypothetical protein Ssi02_76890 [Sinosporangium siamense]